MASAPEPPFATPFASAARTATANSPEQSVAGARGVRLHLDITLVSGTTPTLDVKLQARAGSNDKWIDIAAAAFAQKTAAGTDELVIYPGVAETANESVSDVLPPNWRAVATIAGTTPSFTFSLDAAYIP